MLRVEGQQINCNQQIQLNRRDSEITSPCSFLRTQAAEDVGTVIVYTRTNCPSHDIKGAPFLTNVMYLI